MAPNGELLKKESTWNWGEKHGKALNDIKADLEDPKNLAHFNPLHQSIITCDASTFGLGATLQQVDPEGNRKIVAYASRFLNTAEQKYAINELELLSVVWACEHFKYFIYGKEFSIETDHKALIPILKGNRGAKPYSSRLTRWIQRLM